MFPPHTCQVTWPAVWGLYLSSEHPDGSGQAGLRWVGEPTSPAINSGIPVPASTVCTIKSRHIEERGRSKPPDSQFHEEYKGMGEKTELKGGVSHVH